jgi:F-type H+-transporting ATPase subunit b
VIPDLSVLWVVFFILTTATVLNLLLFKPLLRVMGARAHAVQSARELAATAAAKAQAASEEFEARTRQARADVHQQMEATRRAAQERRSRLLAEARSQSSEQTAQAVAQIRAEMDEARGRIARDADALATAIAERVLGRPTT